MMDNDNSLNKRPTFKRALRNISMTSIFITMMLIWLLLSVTSVLTLKQYAQKNLALTAATMTYRRYFQQFHKPLALPRPHHSADSSQW